MPDPEKNTSLVVFVSPEGEEGVRLTYASASLKTLADSVCLFTLSNFSLFASCTG